MGELIRSHENAIILIASVRAALKNGVKHYNIRGEFLATDTEIIRALARDGNISFDPSERVHRTTIAAELEKVRKEYAEKIQ